MESIRQHLDNLKLQDLLKEESNVGCHASFWEGRKFSLKDTTGVLTFNELVQAVSQKAHESTGNVDGKALYDFLMRINNKGEEELARQSWLVRVVTYVKRFFTAWKRTTVLNELKEMHGFNSFSSYCKSHAGRILEELNKYSDQPIAESQLELYDHTSYQNGKQVSLDLVLRVGQYQLPEKPLDPTSTFPEQFEKLLNDIRITWPQWLDTQKALSKITAELKETIQKSLQNQPMQIAHCVLSSVVILSPITAISNTQKSCFTLSPTLCLLRRAVGFFPTEHVLSLNRVNFVYGSDSFDKILHDWKTEVPQKLQLLFTNQKTHSSFNSFEGDPWFDNVFQNFFGSGFFSSFDTETSSVQKKAPQLEDDLKTIETMLEQPNSLLPLLEQKDYKKLEAELKKALRTGGLKFHEDRLRNEGKSEEEITKATEELKVFLPTVKRAVEKLKELQKSS